MQHHHRIAAAAAHLPAAVRTSEQVEARIALASPGVIVPPGIVQSMTGIRTRRVLPDEENASDLAAHAARKALADAGADPADVDLLVFASASQDMVEPATSHMVADLVDVHAPVFDVKNACNSFLNGLQVAGALIDAGQARTALVVNGETPSRAIKWQVEDLHDLRMSFAGYTFGDAGAAMVLTRSERPGVLYRDFEAHSRHWAVGTLPGGGSRNPRGDEFTYFRGDGTKLRDTFQAIGPGIVQRALAATATTLDDYDAFLVHQVTMPFLHVLLEITGIPLDRTIVTLPDLGNMAAATLPVQYALARGRGDLVPGDRVFALGLAGGVSLGVLTLEV